MARNESFDRDDRERSSERGRVRGQHEPWRDPRDRPEPRGEWYSRGHEGADDETRATWGREQQSFGQGMGRNAEHEDRQNPNSRDSGQEGWGSQRHGSQGWDNTESGGYGRAQGGGGGESSGSRRMHGGWPQAGYGSTSRFESGGMGTRPPSYSSDPWAQQGWASSGTQGGHGLSGSFHDEQRGPHFGRGPKGYQRGDDRILDEVHEALYRDGDVDASDIEVKVQDGEVTLSGTVDDRNTKRMAEDCVWRVTGVREVVNMIRVQDRTSRSSDRETRGDSVPRSTDDRNKKTTNKSGMTGEA